MPKDAKKPSFSAQGSGSAPVAGEGGTVDDWGAPAASTGGGRSSDWGASVASTGGGSDWGSSAPSSGGGNDWPSGPATGPGAGAHTLAALEMVEAEAVEGVVVVEATDVE